MTTDIERQFFNTFGIEPYDRYYNCIDNLEGECKLEHTCCICDKAEDVYCCPEITDRILLGLEDIFTHKKINSTGFFNGFHVEKHNDYWIYQLTYYKGGYYTCGFGKTRKEAFLNQLITILNDKEVEEKEKQLIKQQVQELFKGEQ